MMARLARECRPCLFLDTFALKWPFAGEKVVPKKNTQQYLCGSNIIKITQSFMNGLLEMMTANKWLIEPTFGLKAMRLLNAMAAGHLQKDSEKVYGARFYGMTDGTFAAYADDDDERGGSAKNINEPFINVLHLEGPLTREGGACTYGSRQLRDLMMEAADMEGCLGHLLLINGPGGVSNTISDFLQATDYARSKGQPIVGRIDGYCASAHIWVSAMCDEVYYNSPSDQIGSVGIYWANILNKDGDIDPETGGKWHIVYDPASYDKNRFVRDLAENDDDTLIKEELIKDGETFRNFIKSRRPNVKDEHLHGKMFDAKDVEGIFVVGQATMQETFNRIVELKAKFNGPKTSGRMQAGAAKENILSPTNNSINMKEKFPALFAALQVEEMQMQEGGAFINDELLASLNAKIGTLSEIAENHNQQIADMNAEHASAIEKLNAEHQQAIDDLNAAHATALEEKDNAIAALEQQKADLQGEVNAKDETIATLQAEAETAKNDVEGKQAQIEQLQADVDGARASLATAEQTLAERDQQISDLNAQLAELQNNPGEAPQAGAAPQNNGGGADAPSYTPNCYVYDPNLSYEKNRELEKQWNAEHGK